jgi:PBP1b-binding outer membrane lipoprotein LpoB
MKRIIMLFLILVILVSACSQPRVASPDEIVDALDDLSPEEQIQKDLEDQGYNVVGVVSARTLPAPED